MMTTHLWDGEEVDHHLVQGLTQAGISALTAAIKARFKCPDYLRVCANIDGMIEDDEETLMVDLDVFGDGAWYEWIAPVVAAQTTDANVERALRQAVKEFRAAAAPEAKVKREVEVDEYGE